MRRRTAIGFAVIGWTMLVPVGPAMAQWVSAAPIGNPGEWVGTADYPPGALHEEKEGVTRFVLTIDKTGKVAGCLITVQSGSYELDEATCRLITERARFTPARDERGRPRQGSWGSAVRWQIPYDRQPTPGTFSSSLIVESDGSLSECRIIRSDPGLAGARPVGTYPCKQRSIRPPFTNAKGERVRKRVIRTLTITVEDIVD